MAEWKTPVFDRTRDDVKSVDRTSADYQKGTLNADDLNRIEDNYKYLMAKLRGDAIFIPHRLRNYEEILLERVQVEGTILPDGCTRVEYIESDGNAYIDTLFVPNQNTRVICKAMYTQDSAASYLFGSDGGSGVSYFAFGAANGNLRLAYNTSSYYFESGLSFADVITIDVNKNTATINDSYSVTATEATFNSGYSMYLFGDNRAGTLYGAFASKICFFQVYDNEVLVHDLVSIIDKNGEACFYDQVDKVYHYKCGTGMLTAGPEVSAETTPTYELIETQTTYTDWQEHNLPWLSEINRIRANYNALVRLFLIGLGFSEQPESNYLDYQEVNNWERIALVGKEMFENMEKEYRYCGMEESGGDRLL